MTYVRPDVRTRSNRPVQNASPPGAGIDLTDNYEKNLRSVIDDGSAPEENKTKAKELLDILNERYKSDAREDMPNPKSAIDLKIVKPRFTSNEAYKKEYKKRGRNLLKRINESVTLDKEDKANIKIIEDYLKLFD